MPQEQKPSVPPAPKRPNSDIFRFIDFFVKAGERIRGKKPEIIRGKDGNLVKYALQRLSEDKLETLAIWFFARKEKLEPRIGTMLSKVVLAELTQSMDRPNFWKEINELTDRYYPRVHTASTWQPFSYQDINKMKEDVAALMRIMK
ncbi:MAG: hypothetical protein A3C84_04650 [Candidatus Ryanbacteria bacterium RIFCSPHIGHO2_02_FULL_48_12]|uniref:Uncharacterized protein n=1 Tax=Candidatus Ryanbacteria bacterium RIFCSPHIGHO2_01_FULL_48_27 TaxID=1802115 RepID=A0A1G2G658_9BACT|nr:MAG: hypothetical protein A2756_02150 [Candidatus Ryanbacteria bacterium RIFCSPHIGHO2_01_FULL_48_27]OGZ49868.1 MAG: hypothetical protein A3C84_04650 [Candidatus Ryanbacteria bacterium RIFCSPHIGHO2_02_FULL_48_12]